MKLLRSIITVSPLLLLAFSVSYAQEYAFRSFTVHDGLVSNYITTLKQDSKGYLWIGTDEGFSIFDGKIFSNVRPPKEPMWGQVNSFLESSVDRDVMWIATNGGGLLKYSKGSYRNITIDTILAANRINDLCEDKNGAIWCTTDNGLYRVTEDGSTHFDLPTKQIKEISQILFIDDEHLWIAYSFGIVSFSTRTHESKHILSTELEGTNGHILPMKDNNTTAVITAHALYIYSNGIFRKDLSIIKTTLGNGARDGLNNIWIGASQCVYQLNNVDGHYRIANTFNVQSGLPVNDVTTVVTDRENNIWFGTAGKGIVRLQDPENYRFRFEGLTSRGTTDREGRMWVPSATGLFTLQKNKDNSWQTISHHIRREQMPVALQCGTSDTLWCTTVSRELNAYRIRKQGNGNINIVPLLRLNYRNGLPKIYTFVLYKDSRGYLWTGKDGEGVVVVSTRGTPHVEKIFTQFPHVPPMTISAFCETPDGRIFSGGNGSNALLEFEYRSGAYRYVKAHHYDSLISPYGIRSLTSTPDGSIWIGTRYDGLIRRYPNGTVKQFTYSDGLHSMQVLSLFSNGVSLWIGTQSGMEYVPDIESPRFLLSTELTRSPIYTIGSFNDRTIWAMSRYELTMNATSTSELPQILPPMYLSRFDVNGIPQPRSMKAEIMKNELISCSFTYACVSLKGNIDVKYQYKMDGLHKSWQNLTQERSVTFANLGAGEYTFHVRAVLNNGEQITDTVSQSFVIVPPLWERWWFTPLIIILFFSIGSSLYIFRIRQQVALEKIRVSIAADLHDEIGSALARIANLADILVMHQSQSQSESEKPLRRRTGRMKKGEIVPITNPTKIATLSRELMEKMSDVVWSVNPSNDDLKKLLDRVRTYTTEVAESHHLQLHYEIKGSSASRRIDPQTSRATLLIIKEALSNILVHAKAKNVTFIVEISEEFLSIQIRDDGKGFNESELPRINGLYNMRNRATLCGGSLTITSEMHNGTELFLKLPI